MSYKDNKEVRETKRQAKNLRDYFASRGVDVPHTMALEAVSHLLGDKFWNVTRAKTQPVEQRSVIVDETVRGAGTYYRHAEPLGVWLEADRYVLGDYGVHVRHPLFGYVGCEVKVWWSHEVIFEEWKQGLLDIVFRVVRPVLDESLVATVTERRELVFEVLEFCCVREGTVEAEALDYVNGMVADWRNRT